MSGRESFGERTLAKSARDARGPRRPLRVLGLHGWIRWKLLKRGPSWSTYVLDFHGELEDFQVV